MAVKIRWSVPDFEDVRRSEDVERAISASAERIAAACGEGYDANTGDGRSRSRASVVTTNPGAIRDNARNNTLLRNIDAGRI